MKKLIVGVLVFSVFSTQAAAQEEIRKRSGPRRQLATIVFAGLGGAILGLSTLSFYGRPQEKLQNIAIGFAAGVIAGTTYVTFRSATTREYYEAKPPTQTDLDDSKFQWAPMIAQTDAGNPAYGGQIVWSW